MDEQEKNLGEDGKGHRAIQSAEIEANAELSATPRVVHEKWIVGDERRFGPTKEYFILIPRHHFLDEDWYFRLAEKEAVPASRLFDTPLEAALAAIGLHNETIRWAGVQRQQMQDWYDRLEAEQKQKEELASAASGDSNC